MSDRPLVSILTPTIPERHELLLEAVENVRQQTYTNIEHVIVSDGPDRELRERIDAVRDRPRRIDEELEPIVKPSGVPIVFQELGRHWSAEFPIHSLGVAPILTGMLMARGEYLAWLCDDERFTDPDALTLLTGHLEETGADFVYPKVRMWWNGTSPDRGWDIGTDPPYFGQVTWCLFRASLLRLAMPQFHGPTFNDWDLVERWLAAGARHTFVDSVLVTHRADR